MIMVEVTNKVFTVFLPEEILLDTNTFPIAKMYFLQSQYHQTLKLLYLFLRVINKC